MGCGGERPDSSPPGGSVPGRAVGLSRGEDVASDKGDRLCALSCSRFDLRLCPRAPVPGSRQPSSHPYVSTSPPAHLPAYKNPFTSPNSPIHPRFLFFLSASLLSAPRSLSPRHPSLHPTSPYRSLSLSSYPPTPTCAPPFIPGTGVALWAKRGQPRSRFHDNAAQYFPVLPSPWDVQLTPWQTDPLTKRGAGGAALSSLSHPRPRGLLLPASVTLGILPVHGSSPPSSLSTFTFPRVVTFIELLYTKSLFPTETCRL